MKTLVLTILSFIILLFVGCEGSTGPVGPTGASGTDALIDPSVALKVIWTNPANGQIGQMSRYGEISVRFNKILDMSTVNKSIQLSPSNTGYARIDTNYTSVPTGDLIFISLSADSSILWAIGQTYTMTVLPTLKDVNGNSLSTPYSLSFTPEPYFRVTATYPTNGKTNVSRSYYVEFDFNNRINLSTLQSSISISPAISGTWYAGTYSGGSYAYLSPSSTLNPNTVYTVTLGTGTQDAQGRSLSSPYILSFTTGQ